MPLIPKPNYNQIFASQAPDIDKPAVFNNYPEGWGPESRPNNGKPTIKGFNYLQQTSDLKDLWILQNGACLPYDESIEYAEGAPVLKDGVIQYKTASGFSPGVSEKPYILKYFTEGTSYPLNARVMLDSGDVVKNIASENTNNPNIDSSGWVLDSANYLFTNTYYAEREGFVSGGADNSAVWANLHSRLNNGDVVLFRSGDFHFSAPMEIEKVIRVAGQLRMRDNGTRLHFNGTSGVVRKISGIILENVTIRGTQSAFTPDPETLAFGTVGLEERYDGTFNSGYTSINQVVINGFDTGRTTVKSGTATWAGAYRENYGLHIQGCKSGFFAIGGATHEKFYGGLISANSQYGVYSDAPDMYNNLEFIGTTIEGNGNMDAVNSRNIYDSCNIYSGANSKVTLIGSYNETAHNIARNGGVINKIGSHEHVSSYNFATDGTINLVSSSAAYDNKLRYTATLNSMIYQRTGCTTVQLADSNTVRISSSTSANNLVRFGSFKCQSAIKNKDIFRVKVSFDYDFKSGYTANPTLFVLPTLVINSVTSGRIEAMNAPVFIPVVMLQNSYNERHSFEFYYKPRTDATSYLDEDGLLKDMQLSFQFLNAIGVNPNFTSDNLICDISNLAISILADDQLQFEYDHLRVGATAQRPLLTSSEAGFIYRDTDVMRNVVWNGTRWDILFDDASGVSFTRVTTTELQSATNAINTTNKYAGKLVYNNTTAKMYFSVGSGATSAWRPTDSSADITPT